MTEEGKKVRVTWDMASELMSDEKSINHFLDMGFEPFGITPEPKFNAIQKPGEPMQVLFRVWMKKPRFVAIEDEVKES